jgi:hypothetical protein
MRRRDFFKVIGGLTIARPAAAHTQQTTNVLPDWSAALTCAA